MKRILLLLFVVTNFSLCANVDSLINEYNQSTVQNKPLIAFQIASNSYKVNDSLLLFYTNELFKSSYTHDTLIIDALLLKAKFFRINQKNDSSALLSEEAIIKAQSTNNIERAIKAYSNYGNLERSIGNFDKSLKLFNKADSLLQYTNNDNLKAAIYNNIGIVYTSNEDYKLGAEFYRKILKIEGIELKYYSSAYTNLSGIYTKLQQYDSTIYYGLKAIELKEQNNSTKGLAQAYNNIATAYIELASFESALNWINKALNQYEIDNSIPGIIKANNNLGRIYILTQKYGNALPCLLKAQSLNKDNNYHYEAIHTNKYLYQYYQNQELWHKAFEHLLIYNELNEIHTNETKTKAIKELQVKYETNNLKKEKEIAQANETLSNLKLQNNKKRLAFMAIFGLVTLCLLLFIFTRLQIIRKQKVKLNDAYAQLEESKKNELAVSNLKALQSQMNPHFIFNALNSVQDLVLLKDIRNSNKYLGKFSDLIRKILLSSKEQFISLAEEIEMLSLYLDLEKLRFGDEFKVDFQCKLNEEQQENIELPAMFIQPYIENAIKHGLFHKEGEKQLKVHFTIEEDYLKCVIEDNGIGQKKANELKQKRLHLHTGFSTEAINQRIRLLNQTLERKIEYRIEDLKENNTPKGTKVTLRFPIEK
ncbi:MAG: histidine kinase [Chitinophagales bacterium]